MVTRDDRARRSKKLASGERSGSVENGKSLSLEKVSKLISLSVGDFDVILLFTVSFIISFTLSDLRQNHARCPLFTRTIPLCTASRKERRSKSSGQRPKGVDLETEGRDRHAITATATGKE